MICKLDSAWRLAAVLVCGVLTSSQSIAQSTSLYTYDALGRLVHAGANDGGTLTYVYDRGGNRSFVRCCQPVGTFLVTADGFDPYYYLQTYPDVRIAGVDPYGHWLTYGWREGRWPNRYFDPAWYRATYGIPANVNPLTDFHASGWSLGRNPSAAFSTTRYHATYPDTAAVDPLWHFLRWGYTEGRSAFPVS